MPPWTTIFQKSKCLIQVDGLPLPRVTILNATDGEVYDDDMVQSARPLVSDHVHDVNGKALRVAAHQYTRLGLMVYCVGRTVNCQIRVRPLNG